MFSLIFIAFGLIGVFGTKVVFKDVIYSSNNKFINATSVIGHFKNNFDDTYLNATAESNMEFSKMLVGKNMKVKARGKQLLSFVV
jgi:CO dehydrogenase/acetyl-CoA synthase gamma subunit (corrinoid Fe-S protein)